MRGGDGAPRRLTRLPDRLPAMPSPVSLTVVLPAHNEADRIGPALDELFGYLRRRGERARDGAPGSAGLPTRIDVLVVDDGSSDGTAALVAARLPDRHRPDLMGDRHSSRMRARPALALCVEWDLFRIPFVHRRASHDP